MVTSILADGLADVQYQNIRVLPTADLTDGLKTLLDFPPDDDGNAQAVAFLYGDTIRYSEEASWFYWDGTKWIGDRSKVRQLVVNTLRQRKGLAIMARDGILEKKCSADGYNIANVMELLKDHTKVSMDDFNYQHDLFPASNGIVNLKTGEVLPHESGHGFTWNCPVDYDETADYSEWVNFLLDNVEGGEDAVKALQIAVGYTLTGYTKEEKLFYLYGETRAGKGTFVETIRALMPKPVSQARSMTSFTTRREGDTNNFDFASLKDARMVAASETQQYSELNAAQLKTVTGGDKVVAAFKGQNSFEYEPCFKIWLTSNYAPKANVDDSAVWGRLVIFYWPNSHLDDTDTSLKARFKEPTFLQGVLKWAIEGAIEWYRTGLLIPDVSKQRKQEARDKFDLVSQWIADCLEIGPNYFEPATNVRASYDDWCHVMGIKEKQAVAFDDALKLRVKGLEKRRHYHAKPTVNRKGERIAGPTRNWCYFGCQLMSKDSSVAPDNLRELLLSDEGPFN